MHNTKTKSIGRMSEVCVIMVMWADAHHKLAKAIVNNELIMGRCMNYIGAIAITELTMSFLFT